MIDDIALPEAPYTGIVEGYSPPEGYWLIADIMRRLLAVWWGERCQLADTELFGVPARYGHHAAEQKHEPLCGLEQVAQRREAVEILWQALKDGKIVSQFEDKDGSKRAVVRDQWATLPRNRAHDFLRAGYPWAMGGGEPEIGENGRYFIFEPNEVKVWLKDLKSPHLLPEPLKWDAAVLPDETYISLCEVVTWLAEGLPVDAESCRNQLSQRHEYFHAYLKRAAQIADERTQGFSVAEPRIFEEFVAQERARTEEFTVAEEREFEDFIASSLARDLRFTQAERQIEEMIASGRIAVFGRKESAHERLPQHVLSSGAHLNYGNDQISVGPETSSDDFRHVREHCEWTGVRFLRSQAIDFWGQPPTEKANSNAPFTTVRPSRKSPGAPPKKYNAANAYHRKWPDGHDQTRHTWDNVVEIIASEDGIQISVKSLKSGIDKLNFPRPDGRA